VNLQAPFEDVQCSFVDVQSSFTYRYIGSFEDVKYPFAGKLALLQIYRALLRVYRALLTIYGAHLRASSTLFAEE